jgi:uncharacterized protein involved in exopolysaccharide biosynthesis
VSASAEIPGTPRYFELDLARVWGLLWDSRWLLSVAIVVGAAVAGVATAFLPKYYESTTTLLPVESMDGAGLGGMGNIGNRERRLMPELFPGKWNSTAGSWAVAGDEIPTDEDAFRRFDRKVRHMSQDKKTGVITLTVRWHDPEVAAELANELVRKLNTTMQARAVAESDAAIRQLQNQIQLTDVVPLRGALAEVLESEIKKKTLALVRDEYAMRVIDPAVATAKWEQVSPSLPLFLFGGALLGAFVGALFVLIRGVTRGAGA